MEKTLESLRQLAYRAYYWTSHTPDKYAESVVNDYSEEIDQDINFLKEKGASQEQVERYKINYIDKLRSFLNAKTNCASSAITGSANFNIRKIEKANKSAYNHYNTFREFRDKFFKDYERYENKKSIKDAGGELEIAKQKLEALKSMQERMKRINKAYPAYKKHGLPGLEKFELTEADQKIIISWVPMYSFETAPFQRYELTNNNAKIKNTQARVAELEKKEEKAAGENKKQPFKGGMLTYDYQLDRITIKHDEKPNREVIEALKSHGFKWSPHYGVWMRKITQNAIYVTEKLILPKLN
jgi:hypothetical protein